MNKQWCKDLETIAEGLGGKFQECTELVCIRLSGEDFRFWGEPDSADLVELSTLESLAIEKLGEDAFAEAVFAHFISKWIADKLDECEDFDRRCYLEMYRADAETRARILARMFEVKNGK